MHRISLLPFVLAPLVLQALARPHCKTPANGKVIYMLSNEQENTVVAVPIGKDGLLTKDVKFTATGGAGMNGMDTENKPAFPDPLFSQSSVTIAGNHLFAVNAGSNTVSMFAIDRHDPTNLTAIGKPAAIPAEFPVTVAASAQKKLVCVGASGAVAGVSCASFSKTSGIGEMDDLRVFDLGQTTPPVGPLNTVSQVFFSGDESTLFTTVKGDPATNKTTFLAAFPVASQEQSDCEAGAFVVDSEGVRSSPAGTGALFGSSTIAGSEDLFVTDASFGAAVLSNAGQKSASTFGLKGKAAVDGQSATCWAAISPATNTAFVTDVGVNRLVEMSLTDASIKNVIDLAANGDPGLIDLRAAGHLVYALSPGNGTTPAAVTVVDAVTKKQVQHFQFSGNQFGKNAQGMALLM